MRATLRCASLALVLMLWPAAAAAQNLDVRLDGTGLRVSAPGLRFLNGDALRRLRNGNSVNIDFQIGTLNSRFGAPRDLVTTRFVVSYDLWEEKFAIKRTGAESRSISHLSLQDAEKWCLDSLVAPTGSLSADEQFWVMVGYRIEDPPPASGDGRSTFSLGSLVEIFSQRQGQERPAGRREITGGPYRLSELRRNR
jgi:hypothetical protein